MSLLRHINDKSVTHGWKNDPCLRTRALELHVPDKRLRVLDKVLYVLMLPSQPEIISVSFIKRRWGLEFLSY
jgi:hypothetical protein